MAAAQVPVADGCAWVSVDQPVRAAVRLRHQESTGWVEARGASVDPRVLADAQTLAEDLGLTNVLVEVSVRVPGAQVRGVAWRRAAALATVLAAARAAEFPVGVDRITRAETALGSPTGLALGGIYSLDGEGRPTARSQGRLYGVYAWPGGDIEPDPVAAEGTVHFDVSTLTSAASSLEKASARSESTAAHVFRELPGVPGVRSWVVASPGVDGAAAALFDADPLDLPRLRAWRSAAAEKLGSAWHVAISRTGVPRDLGV